MKTLCITLTLLIFTSFKTYQSSITNKSSHITGSAFFQQTNTYSWKQRDSLAVQYLLAGNVPDFFKKFIPVATTIKDITGKTITATFYVSPDYLGIGTNKDWARVPLTPMAAQQIADKMDCFLPTKRMVDIIYEAADVKLEPKPLTEARDSTATMYQHHQIIEEQRNGRKGLVAGIKKDIVISGKILRDARRNRVAIYGWHKLDGKPIQPLYTGHVNWYVDYSHGVRLIKDKIKVGASGWIIEKF